MHPLRDNLQANQFVVRVRMFEKLSVEKTSSSRSEQFERFLTLMALLKAFVGPKPSAGSGAIRSH